MKLEALASKWADNCRFVHPIERRNPEYAGLGSNIAMTGGIPRNVTRLATNWYEEATNYHYDTNRCDLGKVCRHYIQVS